LTERFFHILARDEWARLAEAGGSAQIVAASVAAEGFAHCSYRDEVEASADRHFAPDAELVALELDPDLIEAEIRVERAPARGRDFPHVYGPIPVAAVVAVWPLTAGADGFTLGT